MDTDTNDSIVDTDADDSVLDTDADDIIVDTDAEEVCVPVSVISTGDYPSQLQLSYNPKPRKTFIPWR